MGATDVCPLIPIAGITLEECAELARQLAKRIADELHVPTYCYEAVALRRSAATWPYVVPVSTRRRREDESRRQSS